MINGICLKKGIKLADRQLMWNGGVRFMYTELKDNSCARSVMNDCEYMGQKFGGIWKLRYAKGAGLGDSQAFDFAQLLREYPYAQLPAVLEINRDDGVLPDTAYFRGLITEFVTRFKNYTNGRHLVIKLTRSLAEWLEPDDFILNQAMVNGLWIHEPTAEISIGKFPSWTLRSYAERAVAGVPAQWVVCPATQAQFDAWAMKNAPLRFLVKPEAQVLSDAEKLAKVKVLVEELSSLLK